MRLAENESRQVGMKFETQVELSPKQSGAGFETQILKAKRIGICKSNYPRSGAERDNESVFPAIHKPTESGKVADFRC